MKKFLSFFVFLVMLATYSCTDDRQVTDESEGMVDFSIKAQAPSGLKAYTRASHQGGATNVTGMELRYIMEVWDGNDMVLRQVKTVGSDSGLGVSFDGRLASKPYSVLFWADFSNDENDNYYKTNVASKGLTDVQVDITKAYAVSVDARDAFYKQVDLDLSNGSVPNETVTLNRALGKIRIVSLDNQNGTFIPGFVKLSYTAPTQFYTQFNATDASVDDATPVLPKPTNISSTGLILGESVKTYDGLPLITTGNGKGDVLAFDYILPTTAGHVVSFDISIYNDNTGTSLLATKSLPNIPIEPNKLTTVVGYFYTGQFKFTVIVEDQFEGETPVIVDPAILIENITSGATFATLADALAVAVNGDQIVIPAGSFSLGNGVSIPVGVTVTGAGRELTKLTANTTAGNLNAVELRGTLQNVSVIYNPARVPGTAWGTENPIGVILFGSATLKDSRVTGFRNGVYANDTSGYLIEGNDITKNRTGIQLANGTSGSIVNNTISDNETIGLLMQYLTSAAITTVPTITGNTFSGNWSSDLENRWANPRVYKLVLNGDGNTFSGGTRTVAVAANSSEGSSQATFTKSSVTFVANIVTSWLDNVDIAGAQLIGMFMIGSTPYATLADALAAASPGNTILLPTGTINMTMTTNVNKAVTIKGAAALASKIVTTGGNPVFTISAGATIDGVSFQKTDKVNQNLLNVTASNVTILNSAFLGTYTLSTDSEVTRAIQGANSITGLSIINNTITGLRQPAYLQGAGSAGSIAGNICSNTKGWVITSGTNFTFAGNSFANSVGFGAVPDIAIINNTPPETNTYTDPIMIVMSSSNNGCKIENQNSGVTVVNGLIL